MKAEIRKSYQGLCTLTDDLTRQFDLAPEGTEKEELGEIIVNVIIAKGNLYKWLGK